MTNHLPALIILIPLTTALALPVLAYLFGRSTRTLALTALAATAAGSIWLLLRVLAGGTVHYFFGGWAPPWGIEYVVDPLAGLLAGLVSTSAFLAALYSGPHLQGMSRLRTGVFYSLFLLLTSGLLGIVTTGDVFNLFVFLEISSLSVYALVATRGVKAAVAAFRYMILGTVGASFYLLGIGYLYAATGTLNMADLAALVPGIVNSRLFALGVGLIAIGIGIKTALFPLHGWLPDAYSRAPAPVVSFISAVQTKVAAYVLLRVLFFILGAAGPVAATLNVVSWAAAAGILFGSILAIAQRDLWRMLAYSSIAQLGFIVMGIAIGTRLALFGALLHMLNHAVMKGCLFMVAGSVFWRTGRRDIERLDGMARRMPLAMAAFFVAAMSMIGLPPAGGFFSKWYLALGALERGLWPFVVVIILSSLLNAIYFFRVIERAYLRPPAPETEEPHPEGHRYRAELPASMLVPIALLGAGVIIMGLFSGFIIDTVINAAIPAGVVLP